MKKEILKGRWAGEEMKTVKLDGKKPERLQRRKRAREGGQGEDEQMENRFVGTVHADFG